MPFAQIRELVALLDDPASSPQTVLDKARIIQDGVEGNLSPRGNIVRLYCTVVIALCVVRITGASREIARTFIAASHDAAVERNEQLQLLTLWYGACTRMMHLFPADLPNESPVDTTEANRLSTELYRLVTRAIHQRNSNFHAVALSMILEEALLTHQPPTSPQIFFDLTTQALRAADADNPRVAARATFLRDVESLGMILAPTRTDYAALLYVPGELAATIK